MIPCPKCGYHNADDAVRCINCGYDICDKPSGRNLPEPPLDEHKESNQKKHCIIFHILATVLIVFAIIRLGKAENISDFRHNTEIPDEKSEKTGVVSITANSGGEIPTQAPTVMPTALIGMDSPIFCKLEMALLHNKAEEMGGGGMLTLDSYSQPEKTCAFLIHDKSSLIEIGTIRTIHNEGDNFGIEVEISSKAGVFQNDRLIFWGAASLASLDSEITQEFADKTIREALETGKAASGNYDISVDEKAIDKSYIISITDRIKSKPEG